MILVSHDERLLKMVCQELWVCSKVAKLVQYDLWHHMIHSGSGTGFGSGSNIKWNTKAKIKNERPTFWEKMLLQTWKRQILYKFFLLKNCAKYCLDREPEQESEPEAKLFQCRNRNGIKSLRFHNTALHLTILSLVVCFLGMCSAGTCVGSIV